MRASRATSSFLLLLAGVLQSASGCGLPLYTDTATSSSTTSTTGTTDTTTGEDAPEVCLRYVACLKEIDAASGADAEATHGSGGSCWRGDTQTQADCLALCDAQLRNYADAFPDIMACDDSGLESDVIFEIGAAIFDPVDIFAEPTYQTLHDGDTMTVVRGGQGLLMLPFGLHGRNFVITEDPNDWDNPMIPTVDMWVDIEDNNVGFGGHFARLNNYAVGFYELNDGQGTLEHMYIAIIVPDAIEDPQDLTSKKGKVHVELNTYGKPTAIRELDFVVAPTIQGF